MLNLSGDAETFAAERTDELEAAIASLVPVVAAAIAEDTWVPVTSRAVELFRAAASAIDPGIVISDDDPLLTDMLTNALAALSNTRETETGSAERETQTEAISGWVATMALNAGTEAAAAANREAVTLEWVTMGDRNVRATHREAGGQRQMVGQPFDVGGYELNYPGQPVGPPALWISCRCALRPVAAAAGVAAAAEVERPWTVVVALPSDDDPIHTVGPEEKHATLLFFGEQDVDLDRIGRALHRLGRPPFTEDVVGRESLGEDGADVLLLDGALPRLREVLLEDEYLAALTAGIDQHPQYTPHVTLGYPDEGWDGEGNISDRITFDRLGLWQGDQRWEFDMPEEEVTEDEIVNDFDPATLEPMQIHGVLAVEGLPTGDYRNLVEDGIAWRDLPIPMRWTPVDNGGHDGAVVVARIDEIARTPQDEGGDLFAFSGTLDDSEDASEVLRMVAEKFLRGVSVDLDSVEAYANEETGNSDVEGRISAATIVQIPAFQEAFVALGPWEDAPVHTPVDESVDNPESQVADTYADTLVEKYSGTAIDSLAISEKSWDGDASRFTLEEYHRSCIVHLHEGDPESKSDCKLPIREPNGDLSRAGVHAAAARINQTDAPDAAISRAKASLRSAYKQLGEDPPEVVAASTQGVDEFAPVPPDVGIPGERGPGWVTNTEDTSRLWTYWTRGPGAAKIAWGTPNDFYRCRRQLAKYIDPIHLNATCAEWHHDALGVWPGQHSITTGETMSTDAMVAAATFESTKPPAAWFTDPGLDGPTPLTVDDDGRVYGHVATWGACHIGRTGECISPPHSNNNYSYFHVGIIDTDDGQAAVGTLSMGGGHADLNYPYRAAVAHYDSTSTAAAYVHLGEDDHGIWMAGMIDPGMSEADVFKLRASGTVSGDWRAVASTEPDDLVAVLAVNVPGYPIPRLAIAASGATTTALVAANVLHPPKQEADLRQAVRAEMRAEARAQSARKGLLTLRANRAKRTLIREGEK